MARWLGAKGCRTSEPLKQMLHLDAAAMAQVQPAHRCITERPHTSAAHPQTCKVKRISPVAVLVCGQQLVNNECEDLGR